VSDWRFAGYDAPVEGWCSRPQRLVNVHTGEWHLKRCGSARGSRCSTCAELHQGDVAAVGRSGWTDHPGTRGYFLTLTAPGADVLPWDRAKCRHSAGVACSGAIGCEVEADALAIWHDDIGMRWSRVIEDVRRELNPGETGLPVSRRSVLFDYMRTWEPQKRGAMHAHALARVEGVCSDKRFQRVLREVATRHGFGKQLDVQMIDLGTVEVEDQALSLGQASTIARKAGYVAKYATKCADALPDVRRLNPRTGELRSGGLRSWSASRNWGDTIKAMRMRRCQWALAAATARAAEPNCGGAVGGALDSYQDHSASGVSSVAVQPVSESVQPV
jgi:hypothetical protein